MPKTAKIKATLRKSDKWRAILTDTSPFEVPVIYSTDGMYKNLSALDRKSNHINAFITAIMLHEKHKHYYKIPYRYRIVKSGISFRQLSLLHPASQANISEFYQKNQSLICYYTSKGSFSLRYPEKVGSTYYFDSSVSDRNKYKNDSVDTSDVDKLTRNPASYFAYRSFDRLYKFFISTQYIELEKRFSIMTSLDVSKCFDSIYTHSIAWAVKEKFFVKDNLNSEMFGSAFDELMQRMNLNETNGICIGPETSRIFAEIILSRIDKDVEDELSVKKIYHGSHYECRRYVDNIYVFSNSEATRDEVHRAFLHKLREYNLHLNDSKTDNIRRPFYTTKSRVVDNTSRAIDNFCDYFLKDIESEERKLSVPLEVKKHNSLRGLFIRDVKDICFSAGAQYDEVASYAISALCKRIQSVIDDHSDAKKLNNTYNILFYCGAVLLLLDVIFFFFTIHPTASTSLRVAHVLILAAKFFSTEIPNHKDSLKESVLIWTSQLLNSPTIENLLEQSKIIPIEFLNLIVSLQEIDNSGKSESKIINEATSKIGSDNYFTIICKLYIYKDHAHFQAERKSLFKDILKKLKDDNRLIQNSENIHLLLDTLTCPFIPTADREALLKAVWQKFTSLDLPTLKGIATAPLIAELENSPWFVNWRDLNLLTLIEKKQLSAVY